MDSRKIKQTANKEHIFNGIDFFKSDREPELLLTDAENTSKILKNAKAIGVDVLFLECWTSKRMEYFTTVCRDIYVGLHNTDSSNWAEKAFEEILREYQNQILCKFPDDKPLFTIGFNSIH